MTCLHVMVSSKVGKCKRIKNDKHDNVSNHFMLVGNKQNRIPHFDFTMQEKKLLLFHLNYFPTILFWTKFLISVKFPVLQF